MQLPKAIHRLEFNHGASYGDEEAAALLEVLKASAPSCGPKVKQFEEAFAAYCRVPHALAVTSATAGLELAMIACEVGPGDEVITTPLSWISTANAIAAHGAKVVFADVDPRTLQPRSGRSRPQDHPAHQSHPAGPSVWPMLRHGRAGRVGSPRGIRIVEDCATRLARRTRVARPALGDIGVFSFHQQKNMTTLGEGGMITASDPKLFERCSRSVRFAARPTIPKANTCRSTRACSRWGTATGGSTSPTSATTSA